MRLCISALIAVLVAPFAGAWIEIRKNAAMLVLSLVAPFAGAWIEMPCALLPCQATLRVAPFAGAWIEILRGIRGLVMIPWSLPSRERGLKFLDLPVWGIRPASLPSRERGLKWKQCSSFRAVRMSLPSRERGLKSALHRGNSEKAAVAPFAGAWIEMCPRTSSRSYPSARRSLRGSVD